MRKYSKLLTQLAKRSTTILSMILLCYCLVACENAGVPSSQIDADVETHIGQNSSNISYTHSVDTTIHKDFVTIDYDINYNYVIMHGTKEFIYSYNKSTDIWTLEHTTTAAQTNHVYKLKQDLSNASFSGFVEGPFQEGFSYEINVIDIDQSSLQAWITYNIVEGDQFFSNPIILTLGDQYTIPGNYGGFDISIVFSLDGLYAEYIW